MEALLKGIDINRRSLRLAAALVIALLCANSARATAQQLNVRSFDGDQQAQWTWGQTEQSFPEVRWDVVNAASSRGCVVSWSATPFVHQNNIAEMDVRLAMRLTSGQPRRARWNVKTSYDQSAVSDGRREAVVSLASQQRGAASVGIVVSMIADRTSIPTAGNYSTTLVATLSGL